MRAPISLKTRFDVLKRDRFTCQYCGARPPKIEIRVDHIQPVAKGGTNSIENLITACFECNAGKRDGEVTEFFVGRRVWERVRVFPHFEAYDDEHRKRMTLDVVQMFCTHGFEDVILELSERMYSDWEDWRTEAQLWFRDYLAHCVDMGLGTNGYMLLREHASSRQVLS